jgi:hypothetical protein
MRVLLPQGIRMLGMWHIDGGIHPEDSNLRLTKCGMRYVYERRAKPQALRHFYCPICR